MPQPPTVKPSHQTVKRYYAALAAYRKQGVVHEGAVRSAFQNLLEETGRRVGWTLIPELLLKVNGNVHPDATFRDDYYITHGYWEAKDTDDDLETEIRKKVAKGYPLSNTIFEDTRRGHLFQNGAEAMVADLSEPRQLCDLLNCFYAYTKPDIENFEHAIGFQRRSRLARISRF